MRKGEKGNRKEGKSTIGVRPPFSPSFHPSIFIHRSPSKLAAASLPFFASITPAGRSMPTSMNGIHHYSSSLYFHRIWNCGGESPIYSALLFLLHLTHKAIALPQPGPCTLIAGISLPPALAGLPPLPGMNPKLKCTEKGYFELVQCFDNYCVCVDAGTGAEATATRTASNRLSPQCGRCHTQLARYYLDNSNFVFRPICDPKTGNYQAKQCKDDEHCFCVNVLNGFKLSKGEAPNGKVKCEDSQFDFSIDASQITKTEQLGGGRIAEQHIPIGNPICKLPKDSGIRCKTDGNSRASPISAKSVKWYFDPDTFDCLAFAYQGCEGNQNRFDSVTECWDRCKLADLAGCAGMTMPATNSQGHTIICSGLQEGTTQSCPNGYRCIMLAFMGVCCNSANQDLYERNYRPTCANGGQPIKMQAGGAPANLIGKKCSDDFCPSGSKCFEKEIFAHCCSQ